MAEPGEPTDVLNRRRRVLQPDFAVDQKLQH